MAAMIAAANATYGHPARGQRATFQIGDSGCYLLTSKAAFAAMTRGRLMRGRLASRSSIRDGPSICLLSFTTTLLIETPSMTNASYFQGFNNNFALF